MKTISDTLGKTGTAITAILTILVGVTATWAIISDYHTKNMDGGWHLKFTVNSSSYKPYIGKTHTQKIVFTQKNKSVIGNVQKWEYNGKLLPFDMSRTLEYIGYVDGSQFNARFKFFGKSRQSEGNICLQVSEDGKHVEGTFIGTAGNNKGTVTGDRID
jgi:hypothetical protein